MKKKLTLIVSAVALGALLAVGGTLAWFTDTETATNVVTMGNVNVALLENGAEYKGGDGLQFTTVTPGANLDKDVTVDNTGANAAFIRAKVEIEGVVEGNAPLEFVGTNSKWELNTDGYYYYNEILAATASTASLFTDVKVPTSWGNNAANSGLNIKVTVEAVQSDNNATTAVDAFKDVTVAPAAPVTPVVPAA